MTARDAILQRIRSQQGRQGETPDAERAAVRDHIARRARGPLPAAAISDRVARFLHECDQLSTTHARVPSRDALPKDAARYLAERSLAMNVVGWPTLADLDWSNVGVTYASRPAMGTDTVGVTDCFCAIAETGTLMLLGSRDTPKSTALLPETHLCLVHVQRIVDTMEDAFALLRAEVGEPPRALFMVSGPSRTADIEQTIVIGAHGPYRVHVVLVG